MSRQNSGVSTADNANRLRQESTADKKQMGKMSSFPQLHVIVIEVKVFMTGPCSCGHPHGRVQEASAKCQPSGLRDLPKCQIPLPPYSSLGNSRRSRAACRIYSDARFPYLHIPLSGILAAGFGQSHVQQRTLARNPLYWWKICSQDVNCRVSRFISRLGSEILCANCRVTHFFSRLGSGVLCPC
jgi:hypothetical protein